MLFWSTFHLRNFRRFKFWFLNFDTYKLVFVTLDCLKLKSFEYQVCSAPHDIQLLFLLTFHLRRFSRFKFVIFKFRHLQTSFRNPRLSQKVLNIKFVQLIKIYNPYIGHFFIWKSCRTKILHFLYFYRFNKNFLLFWSKTEKKLKHWRYNNVIINFQSNNISFINFKL